MPQIAVKEDITEKMQQTIGFHREHHQQGNESHQPVRKTLMGNIVAIGHSYRKSDNNSNKRQKLAHKDDQ